LKKSGVLVTCKRQCSKPASPRKERSLSKIMDRITKWNKYIKWRKKEREKQKRLRETNIDDHILVFKKNPNISPSLRL